MDTCDALLGGFNREPAWRSCAIPTWGVRGGRRGLPAAGQAGGADRAAAGSRTGVLILFPCLSRAAMLLVMESFPYARARGSARRSRAARADSGRGPAC